MDVHGTNDPGGAFIAACLAPMPEGSPLAGVLPLAEQRRAKRDLRDRWWRGYHRVWMFDHLRRAASFAESVNRHEGTDYQVPCSEDGYYHAVASLMLVPALRLEDLRWKQKHRKLRHRGHPDWETAIAADEARLLGAEG